MITIEVVSEGATPTTFGAPHPFSSNTFGTSNLSVKNTSNFVLYAVKLWPHWSRSVLTQHIQKHMTCYRFKVFFQPALHLNVINPPSGGFIFLFNSSNIFN
jgi:hypothetical protein